MNWGDTEATAVMLKKLPIVRVAGNCWLKE